MASIDFTAIDEIIRIRKTVHGGGQGKPKKLTDTDLEGASLNRAAVIFLAARLQAYVGEVFLEASEHLFDEKLSGKKLDNYLNTWRNWGNASPANIKRLFCRLGVDDVLADLSWKGQGNATLVKNLDNLNQVRNKIAHGEEIRIDGRPFNLTMAHAERWRNVVFTFSNRFSAHAMSKVTK